MAYICIIVFQAFFSLLLIKLLTNKSNTVLEEICI